MDDLSSLLQRAEGDPAAADRLFAMLYDELHRLAERHLRREGGALTLGTTTLVHEAWLSMTGKPDTLFPDRARFFAYAARAMRGLAIDYARRRHAGKRGRQYEITLDESVVQGLEETDLPDLGAALDELTRLDPALAELVDLHFFGGFSFVEIAELRGVSERTIQREWRKARLLLHHAMREDEAPS